MNVSCAPEKTDELADYILLASCEAVYNGGSPHWEKPLDSSVRRLETFEDSMHSVVTFHVVDIEENVYVCGQALTRIDEVVWEEASSERQQGCTHYKAHTLLLFVHGSRQIAVVLD
jgi:hypothetical protein